MQKTQPVKPHKTFAEQVEILVSRGLIIEDIKAAELLLSQVNYYHLRGYYIDVIDPITNRFHPGTTLSEIVARFYADDCLRQALIPFLRAVEFSVRTACSYTLSSSYGPLGYRDSKYFVDQVRHENFIKDVDIAVGRSKEPFIKTHKTKYGGQYPVWVIIELLSFGAVSKLYSNMLPRDKKSVSKRFDFSYNALKSLLHSLVVFRNTCAHHARLYGRRLTAQYPIPSSDIALVKSNDPEFDLYKTSVYAAVLGIAHLLNTKDRMGLVESIRGVVKKHPDYDLKKLGFPELWNIPIEEMH